MGKEEIIFFIGNVLVGMTCPFLFLLSDNPFKTLCGIDDKEGEE